MSFPTILVDSASGSDSLASGAGPATALTGSAASTDATGLVATLDGSPSLAGVLTDGSHCLYLADATAGGRNFGKITAKDDTAKTVTVSDAFGLSLTGKAWAIGGKRASIGSTASRKLVENNSLAGDAMPGWAVEMASGHAETIASIITTRRAGDVTDGPITIRGVAAAATMPVLTASNNAALFAGVNNISGWVFEGFEARNSNATKTASIAFSVASGTAGTGLSIRISGVRIVHATNLFWKGVVTFGMSVLVDSCEIAHCASHAVSGAGATRVYNCALRDNVGDGIQQTSSNVSVEDSLVVRNAVGVNLTTASGGNHVVRSTIHGNASSGIIFSSAAAGLVSARVQNNNITGNGAYGLNLSGSPTAGLLAAAAILIRNNNFGTGATANTSGAAAGITLDASNLQVDPGYTDGTSATNNFAVGANVKALGHPTANIGGMTTGTRSYVDIGAAQRQEPGGAGGPVGTNFRGGFSNG